LLIVLECRGHPNKKTTAGPAFAIGLPLERPMGSILVEKRGRSRPVCP
jgi:hypothetical protein